MEIRPIEFSRKYFFEGFTAEGCKVSPRIVTADGKRIIIFYEWLLFQGSDVVSGIYKAESFDGGETFSEPCKVDTFADETVGNIRYAYSVGLRYHKGLDMWYSSGHRTAYVGSDFYRDEKGRRINDWVFRKYDINTDRFEESIKIEKPEGYEELYASSQCVELDNNEIIIPFYGFRKGSDRMICLTAKYRMTEKGFVLIEAGESIDDDDFDYGPYHFVPDTEGFGERGRGIYEPALVENHGKYYMTIRNDNVGLFATSSDGFKFGELKPWTWDDGSVLKNYNTFQRFIKLGDTLYLVYTRITPHNSHVFRHRAPLFMAQIDEEKQCLIRESERILVPELGARLGNFNVCRIDDDTSLVITCEWMQGWEGPEGCKKYGSNNRVWVARVQSKK